MISRWGFVPDEDKLKGDRRKLACPHQYKKCRRSSMAEHLFRNQKVKGSTPFDGSIGEYGVTRWHNGSIKTEVTIQQSLFT